MSIDLAEQLKHADGKDCRCCAYAYNECACGCDWTPSEVYELRAALAAEQARAERLAGALRPFADLAELFDDDRRGGNMPSTGLIMSWPRIGKEYDMTVEHLRAAVAALALRPSGDGVGHD